MFAMIQSDFITMKGALLQQLGICVIIALIIWVGTGTLIAGIAALCAMIPFMYIFSIAAYDEINCWERFRLTLPISRKQVVLGRYASILIVVLIGDLFVIMLSGLAAVVVSNIPSLSLSLSFFEGYDLMRNTGHTLMISAAMLVVAALAMPLFMRYGMTKGTRLAPVVIIFIMMGLFYFLGNIEDYLIEAIPSLELIFGPDPQGALLSLEAGLIAFAVVFVIFAISAFIAIKLYEKREF